MDYVLLSKIRHSWLKYFGQNGYKIIPTAPLLHPAFPLSFNMSAGLVQIDTIIRGKEHSQPIKECVIQKCFRHFDVDKVGDGKHLSFFEMAGAFEILKYQKIKTINHVWKYLTVELKIDPTRIWITCIKNVQIENKTIQIEKQLLLFLRKLVGQRLTFGNKDTNLWKQGGGIQFQDNKRLCGPQIELFYQINSSYTKSENPLSTPNKFIEISNTIFIEYYIDYINRSLKRLKNKAVESVIGIERVAKAFETSNKNKMAQTNIDQDILEDHLKSLLFIFSEESIKPGKSGRNRIIRTLIRNILAICYTHELNQVKTFEKILSAYIKNYEDIYPEIINGKSRVIEVIAEHNVLYKKTIDKAILKINKLITTENIKKFNNQHLTMFKEKFGIPQKLVLKNFPTL